MRKRRQKLLYEVLIKIDERIVSNAINPSNFNDVVYLEANPIKKLIGRFAAMEENEKDRQEVYNREKSITAAGAV